jgi:hypothetical protein
MSLQQDQSRRIVELKNELYDMKHSFRLRWNADIRAIKRWQEATGRTMEWPDHADLCVWLMERITELEKSANPKLYFESTDNSSHHYIVEWDRRFDWYKWQDLDDDDPESWKAPSYAIRKDGGTLTFRDPANDPASA